MYCAPSELEALHVSTIQSQTRGDTAFLQAESTKKRGGKDKNKASSKEKKRQHPWSANGCMNSIEKSQWKPVVMSGARLGLNARPWARLCPWVAIIVEAMLVNQSEEKLTPKVAITDGHQKCLGTRWLSPYEKEILFLSIQPYRLKEMASARKKNISRPGLAGPGRPGIPQAQALGPPKPCVGLGPA
ncbi:hypothetical protein C8R45DRAFT_945671 [Mycena sanguinolenta]|nr:hypothetical protein C8R45DRAFT_945671 [Mycena sanguinolenta]